MEVTRLFRAVGPEFLEIVNAADELRARVNGEKVGVNDSSELFWFDVLLTFLWHLTFQY